MSADLPEGWAEIPFEHIITELRNGLSTKPNLERPGISILRISAVRPGNVSQDDRRFLPKAEALVDSYGLRERDLLFTRYNGSLELLGVCGMVRGLGQEPLLYPDKLMRVRVDESFTSPEYVELFFQSPDARNAIMAIAKSSAGQQGISGGDLKQQKIALAPLVEQLRIVAIVKALLAQVNVAKERLARVSHILNRFRQAVLTAACAGKLTEDWREAKPDLEAAEALVRHITSTRKNRYEEALKAVRKGHNRPRPYANLEPQLRTDLEYRDIPRCWTWVDLRFLMHEEEPFCYGVVQPGEDAPNGVPLIRAGDLHSLPSLDGLRRIPAQVDAQYERSRIRGGEILVTVVGANIGTVSMAPIEARGFNTARAVAKVPVRDFDAKYVLLWLKTSTARSWMTEDAREVARPTLNLEQLQTLLVPLPPLEEQHEIVRRAEALLRLADTIENRVAAATIRAERLPQSILSKAFRGELIPTEAELANAEGRDFEPADVLLERIRRQREENPANRPSKAPPAARGRQGRKTARAG